MKRIMNEREIAESAFWRYHFSSPCRFIISGIFQCILEIPSFMTFMSSSLISTSIVTFILPFFSSDIEPPPQTFQLVRKQVIDNVNSLPRIHVQINLDFVMELAQSAGWGLVL